MALSSKILLNKFSWESDYNVFVVGFTWIKGICLKQQDFIGVINANRSSFEVFQHFVSTLNGQFSIIVEQGAEVWLACSHTWSYPLFYKKGEDKVYISDDPECLIVNDIDKKTDPLSELYFLSFGVTPKNATLSKSVLQLRPGEVIAIRKTAQRSFFSGPFADVNICEAKNIVSSRDLYQHLLTTFENYYEQIKGKQVLLPLTKGYDSRLLACLLSEFGHKNVVCATWGRKDNTEMLTAQRVAQKLGFKYCFVEYTNDLIREFYKTNEFNEYVKFAGHWSSMPYLQDYFAVRELCRMEVINENTIAIPGHPGDYLRGAHFDNSDLSPSFKKLYLKISTKFSSSFPFTAKQNKNLSKFFCDQFFHGSFANSLQTFERWDYEERQCKFIANSASVFQFFKMDYLMPLFDLETISFFRDVPLEQKIGEVLYNDTLEKFFFKKCKVDFDLKLTTENKLGVSQVKNGIIKLVPRIVKTKYYPMKDNVFYQEITKELRNVSQEFSFKHPVKPHFYNSYIIQWYLQHIKNNKNE